MRRQIDYDRFQATIGWLAEAFTKELSSSLCEIYWEALKDLSWDAHRWAVASCIRDGKHFPRPSEIRDQAERFYVSQEAQKRKAEEEAEAKAQSRDEETWRHNPILRERDRARFRQIWNEHGAGHPGGAGREGCRACAFEAKHPRPWERLRNGLFASDIDWEAVA